MEILMKSFLNIKDETIYVSYDLKIGTLTCQYLIVG